MSCPAGRPVWLSTSKQLAQQVAGCHDVGFVDVVEVMVAGADQVGRGRQRERDQVVIPGIPSGQANVCRISFDLGQALDVHLKLVELCSGAPLEEALTLEYAVQLVEQLWAHDQVVEARGCQVDELAGDAV